MYSSGHHLKLRTTDRIRYLKKNRLSNIMKEIITYHDHILPFPSAYLPGIHLMAFIEKIADYLREYAVAFATRCDGSNLSLSFIQLAVDSIKAIINFSVQCKHSLLRNAHLRLSSYFVLFMHR